MSPSTLPVNLPATPVQSLLERIHHEVSANREGSVATYIPELAKADPDHFGICLVTATGSVYEMGDTRQPFTIQSISKPFVYGLALEDNGTADMLARIGVEPTGDAFNSISLEPDTGRPRNPMINAGAIATTGLIAGRNTSLRERRILEALSLHAGRALEFDDNVYRSESATGHRNRAIGHMLRNFAIIEHDPMATVELYFKQCSIRVDCRDLATMAATLANHGVNPLTHARALRGEYVENVLSVMGTCGMYDWAGKWLYRVGLPAKSGVSGGVLAVLPGQLGIGVYSPRLDNHGNSVRGIRVCELLSRYCDLHLFNLRLAADAAIRLRSTASQFNSRRVRTAGERAVLREHGDSIHLFQLQGHLNFTTTEVVSRAAVDACANLRCLVLDLRRVLALNESAAHLLHDLLVSLDQAGQVIVFAHAEQHPPLRRILKARLRERLATLFHSFPDADAALEWCEDRIIAATARNYSTPPEILPAGNELLAGLTPEQCQRVAPMLRQQTYSAGTTLITAGDHASELFLLVSGEVSVLAPGAGGRRRLASFSPGMVFGEMALIDRAPRSATIVADTDVTCALLSTADFESLAPENAAIKIKLLENLALGLCRKLRKSNREMGVLE